MHNVLKELTTIMSDTRIYEIVGDNVFSSYPETVTTFPCVIYLDSNQHDIEFADNQPLASDTMAEVHIFTKALSGYPTTAEIGIIVATVMRDNFYVCTQNGEVPDPEDSVRHRRMTFRRAEFI